MKTSVLIVRLVAISFITVTCLPTESKIKAHGVAKRQAEQEGESECIAGEFQCPNGYCIPGRWVCDDEVDCYAGGDEGEHCIECAKNELYCYRSNTCKVATECDGIKECSDGEDEASCTPACWTFECDNGHCLPYASWECDNYIDCSDNSDEKNCPACKDNEFSCANGICKPASYECDNYNDCGDYSDEVNCPCDGFKCDNGQCLPYSSWKCDNYDDCKDKSDEEDCPDKRKKQFKPHTRTASNTKFTGRSQRRSPFSEYKNLLKIKQRKDKIEEHLRKFNRNFDQMEKQKYAKADRGKPIYSDKKPGKASKIRQMMEAHNARNYKNQKADSKAIQVRVNRYSDPKSIF